MLARYTLEIVENSGLFLAALFSNPLTNINFPWICLIDSLLSIYSPSCPLDHKEQEAAPRSPFLRWPTSKSLVEVYNTYPINKGVIYVFSTNTDVTNFSLSLQTSLILVSILENYRILTQEEDAKIKKSSWALSPPVLLRIFLLYFFFKKR